MTSSTSLANEMLRVRDDVIFARSSHGTLIHNADEGFEVKGVEGFSLVRRLFTALDGRKTGEHILEDLPGADRSRANALIKALDRHGFLLRVPAEFRDISPEVREAFASQMSYLLHFSADPGPGFRRIRDAKILVVGEGPAAAWAVIGLMRNGFTHLTVRTRHDAPPREVMAERETMIDRRVACELDWQAVNGQELAPMMREADHVIVASANDGQDIVARCVRLAEDRRIPVTALWRFGDGVIVGPVPSLQGEEGTGWMEAAARVSVNSAPHDAARFWGAVQAAPGVAAVASAPATVEAMVGNLAAFEVFREVGGARNEDAGREVLIQDIHTADVVSAPIVGSVTPRPEGRDPHGPERGHATALERLEATADLVNRHTGIFRVFEDEPLEQLPLKISRLRYGMLGGRDVVVDAWHLETLADARCLAIEEAAARLTSECMASSSVREESVHVAASFDPEEARRKVRWSAARVRAVRGLARNAVEVDALDAHEYPARAKYLLESIDIWGLSPRAYRVGRFGGVSVALAALWDAEDEIPVAAALAGGDDDDQAVTNALTQAVAEHQLALQLQAPDAPPRPLIEGFELLRDVDWKALEGISPGSLGPAQDHALRLEVLEITPDVFADRGLTVVRAHELDA